MEVRTQSVHFDADETLLTFINEKVEKLETFYDNIVSADVILRLQRSGQIQDKIAEIKINVPGATLIVKETKKTFEEAVDLGASSLRRQLLKYKSKQRG
ncbi:MAG: ribosome-associated translation inhibitor RaiA [Aureispira sp.]|nr:ribosome-associated translation inhibitor RaiA [Aureispira sp.]